MTINKDMSRRDFLKLSAVSAASVGLLYVGLPKLMGKESKALAAESNVTEIPIIWLATGACTGCSVSLLNSLSPNIRNLLVDEVVPNKHLSVRYHTTIMASEGQIALDELKKTASSKGGYILVVDGSISTNNNGLFCEVGEDNGQSLTGLDQTKNLGKDAMAVIAIGTCASYGGIPSASPNTTGCVPLTSLFKNEGINTPVINVPGCAPHPDWFVGTVATILLEGLQAVKLDSDGRPIDFYGIRVHDRCPRNGYFQLGQFSKKFSDPYCMFQLGCKGPITFADCPIRLWNSANNWCVGANSLCIGCVQPGFPDVMSPLMKKAEDWQINPLSPPHTGSSKPGLNTGIALAAGAVAGAAVVGAGVFAAKQMDKSKPSQKD